jgi:hypothetical protein
MSDHELYVNVKLLTEAVQQQADELLALRRVLDAQQAALEAILASTRSLWYLGSIVGVSKITVDTVTKAEMAVGALAQQYTALIAHREIAAPLRARLRRANRRHKIGGNS